MPIHPLSSSQAPVFLVNSRLGRFDATPSGCDTLMRHPFSQSYGVNLPSSFARVISIALGFSPCLPVSVCGTVIHDAPYEDFLVSVESPEFSTIAFPITTQPSRVADLPTTQPKRLDHNHHVARTILLRPPFGQTHQRRYRNINLLSIDYALRPRLRTD